MTSNTPFERSHAPNTMTTEKDKAHQALDDLVEHLFTNGGGHKADRLLLVKEDYRCSAHVTKALDLGGYSREAVRDVIGKLLTTRVKEARQEAFKDAIAAARAHQEAVRDRHYGVVTLVIEAIEAASRGEE